MRERKFRAWEPEEKKMYHDVWFDDEEVFWDDPEDEWCVIGYYKEDKQALDFPVLEITEYVGMKDKHGKEIYEGDIVNILGLGCENVSATIEFVGGGFLYMDCNSALYGAELIEPDITVVVGNIFEGVFDTEGTDAT